MSKSPPVRPKHYRQESADHCKIPDRYFAYAHKNQYAKQKNYGQSWKNFHKNSRYHAQTNQHFKNTIKINELGSADIKLRGKLLDSLRYPGIKPVARMEHFVYSKPQKNSG